MKFFGVALAAALASVGVAEVFHATDADFDEHIAKHRFALVELYAPWCGHCKQLEPQYKAAAEELAKDDIEGGVTLVAVDATEHKELATRFGVQGFPTLKWMVDGEASDYGGGRQKEDIIAWIRKKTGPAATDLEDAAGLESFKEKADVVVVGHFADKESDAAKAFLAAAQADDDATYGISTSDEVKDAAGLSGDGVVIFRKFEAPDEPRVECEGELTKDSIKSCVSANILPLIIPFSQANAPKIFGGAIKQHVLVFLDKTADHKEAAMAASTPVAVANKGEYLFVTVDKTDDRILDFFGITGDDLPTARVVEMNDGGMKKFALEGDLTEDNLAAFVKSHASGELKPALKSEDEIPESEQGNVWTLVGTNHDDIVFGSGKNVLVEYYAPWCGHCKKLAPIYEELGEAYKDDDNVIIAQMDSTANEAESVQVQGFPTLKFMKAGSDELQDFDGGRDLESLKKYIEDNRA